MRLTRRGVLALGASVAAGVATAGCDSGGTHVASENWSAATALTDTEDAPHALGTDGTEVYFATGGSQVGENAVRAVPLDAGSASRIVSTQLPDFTPDDELAVADGAVYVGSLGAIYAVTVADRTTAIVVPERPGSILDVAVGGGHLWWSTGSLNNAAATEVARMPLGGGPVEILATGIETDERPYVSDVEQRRAVTVPRMTSASRLVLDGDGALVACTEGILRVTPGAAPAVVVTTDTPASQLVVSGETVYFLVVGKRTSLRSAPRSGGEATDAGVDLDDTGSIAVVGDQVVGVRVGGLGSGDGRIVAAPLGGGDVRTLAAGPYVGTSLVATGATVVFIGDGRVWSVPV